MNPDLGFVTVRSGPHERAHAVVRAPAAGPLRGAPSGSAYALASSVGSGIPAQVVDGELVFVLPESPAGATGSYALAPAEATTAGVTVTREGDQALTVERHGTLVTRYVYGSVPARPYFYPVVGPGDVALTRAYPMLPDAPGETRDHPHHKSIWIAHGEVNGADNWSDEPGHGYTIHKSIDLIESGPVAGRFQTRSVWTDAQRSPLLQQTLTVTAYDTGPDVSLLDFDISLTALRDLHFGDTKEGGILSVRVASAMDVPRGGRIENSFGGIDEGETWGKSAHWCDYSGVVDGQHAGIAILDGPASFRHPVRWHVRDYGLMTANPFGYAAFTNGRLNGAHDLPAGETLAFHYRLVLHRGDAPEGRVREHYLNYAAPPRAEWTEQQREGTT